MHATRLVPTTFVLAALIIGSACSASTADNSGEITPAEPTVETSPSAAFDDQPSTTAPTITPTTNRPTTAPSVDSVPINTVDVAGQTVFGLRRFDAVDVEVATDGVSARLGSPTSDSGWQSMAGRVDCTGSTEFRVLWWGDFRMTFERYQGDGTVRDELSEWTVGNPILSGLVPIGDVPSASPSNIVTLEGIGLGSTLAGVEAAWANLNGSGDGRIVVIDRGGTLVVTLDADDHVVGFGNGPFDCPSNEIR